MKTKALLIIVALAMSALPVAATAGKLTHLGQTAGDHVTLEAVGGITGGCGAALLDFVRVLPSGGREAAVFRVPSGMALIVTDADWQYVHPSGAAAAGTVQVLRLFIENLADPFTTNRAMDSAVVLSDVGIGGVSEAMTSGFVVSSEARVCPDLFPGPLGPPSGLQHLLIRGYLVEDK